MDEQVLEDKYNY